MSHRYRKKPPTTHLYRHFAVVTVAVTGLLTVFAEGEKAELQAAQSEQPRALEPPTDKPAPAAKRGTGGVWGDDTPASFAGSPGSVDWGALNDFRWADMSGGRYPPEYLAALSEEDRAALEAAIAESTAGTPAESSDRIARLEAASRLRSGSAGRE